MQLSASLQEQRAVGDLLGQGVLEGVGRLRQAGLLVDEFGGGQPREALVDGGRVFGNSIQQPAAEISPDDGGELKRRLRRLRQAVDACRDHALDGVRNDDGIQGRREDQAIAGGRHRPDFGQ